MGGKKKKKKQGREGAERSPHPVFLEKAQTCRNDIMHLLVLAHSFSSIQL
jgi:hypothetical protein